MNTSTQKKMHESKEITSGNRSVMVCLTRRHQYVVIPERKFTHMSFHVARPNAALVAVIQQSEPKPDVKKKNECTYFAVSFPNFAMITPPLTPPVAGFGERLGCSIFSTPPSPKTWSVHGSMYDREGGCMSARKASKDCVIIYHWECGKVLWTNYHDKYNCK